LQKDVRGHTGRTGSSVNIATRRRTVLSAWGIAISILICKSWITNSTERIRITACTISDSTQGTEGVVDVCVELVAGLAEVSYVACQTVRDVAEHTAWSSGLSVIQQVTSVASATQVVSQTKRAV